MTDKVDEFESIFKRASKARFHYACPRIQRIVLVTDEAAAGTAGLQQRVQHFLDVLSAARPQWHTICGDDYGTKGELMQRLAALEPDLICSYRNLKQQDKDTLHSLGSLLDSLTQETGTPVVVLPDALQRQDDDALAETSTVMVITDHLTADDRLINYGMVMTRPGGELHLCHVEDDAIFRYYLETIEKIPALETARAGAEISEQLLKQPADYIQSCIDAMQGTAFEGHIHAHVLMGHTVQDYARLLDANRVDLLVLNTKDEDQLAMRGKAYAVAVEFRRVPLLML